MTIFSYHYSFLFRSVLWPFLAALVLQFDLSAEPSADFHRVFDSEPTEEIWRARFFLRLPDEASVTSVRGVLILCPGQNVNGSGLASSKFWRSFAEANQLALVGVHFNSPDAELDAGRGYFRSWRGSGPILEDCLTEWELSDKPIFLYGFSGGAYFVHSFAQTTGLKVAAWAAFAARFWEQAPESYPHWKSIPGVLACGDDDTPRFSATFHHFQNGRVAGAKWAWYPISQHGHGYSTQLDEFVIKFFEAFLDSSRNGSGTLVDNTTQKQYAEAAPNRPPELLSWLPCDSLLPYFRSQ